MKRLFLFISCIVIMFMLSGCNKYNSEKLLIGEWSYEEKPNHSEGGWGNIFSYEFQEDGKVKYFECLHLTLTEDGCTDGSSTWIGNYKIQNNIIEIKNFQVDKTDSYNPSTKLNGPSDSLIIDFNNMYFCNRENGLDCKMKYKKEVKEK